MSEKTKIFKFPQDVENLLLEAEETGGITVYCECGNCSYTEPDGEGWCEVCNKTILNPLIENGFIQEALMFFKKIKAVYETMVVSEPACQPFTKFTMPKGVFDSLWII